MPANASIRVTRRLPVNVIALGCVSLLMAMSSQMTHSLLPVFLTTVLNASVISVGFIEGIAEATNSFAKLASGALSDWIGRRKPLVVVGYGLAALSKPLFPLAGDVGTVLIARFFDRSGKGIRDAPRDALLADQLPANLRGSGYGLRLTLFTIGSVIGPLIAVAVMIASGGDIRFVFWIAVIPAFVSVAVLVLAVTDSAVNGLASHRRVTLRGLSELPARFWWLVALTAVLELARFSQAFLLLKAKEVGVDAAFIPIFLVLMSAVYGLTAYPFGVLADNGDRRRQLAVGVVLLFSCHVVLAAANTVWMTAVGACLWGLQMGVIASLMAASVADAAPAALRGTAFGIYYVVDGVVSLLASAGAGVIWAAAGSAATFSVGAGLSAAVLVMLAISPIGRVGIVSGMKGSS
jgi:MFS family permease